MIVEKIAVINLDRNSSSFKMSDSDTYLSSDTSNENSDGTGANESDETSEEMEVFGQVEPYEGEPRASSDDEDEADEETDQDGLSPAVLRSRFERDVAVTEWRVCFYFCVFPCPEICVNLFVCCSHVAAVI